MAASEAETSAALNELCAAAGVPPRGAVHHPGSFRDVKRFLAGARRASPTSRCGASRSTSPGRCPTGAVEALAAHVGARPDGVVCELDFSPWAGAYARVAPDATAFAHRDARFLLKPAVTVPAGADPARRAGVARGRVRDHPPARHRRRVPELPRQPTSMPGTRRYHLGNRERLLELKRRYDPDGLLRSRPRSVE